jgi:8-hydroxy-5-deazaflavin:NADPH oxidoreductase
MGSLQAPASLGVWRGPIAMAYVRPTPSNFTGNQTMLYAIAGVSGHTGRVVADALLEAGERVRVIVRDAAKGEAWTAKGAEVAVADLGDVERLTAALRGVDGCYLLLPTDPAPGFRAAQRSRGQAIVAAVAKAKPPHVVFLSSFGAQHPDGTGPIAGLHPVEQGLRQLHAEDPSSRITLLRGGSFMENLGSSLAALGDGVVRGFLPADLAFPMVATVDVGRTAASLLQAGGDGLQVIQLGSDHSWADAAAALTHLVGRPIRPVSGPVSAASATLQGYGMPADLADLYQEMTAGILSGRVAWEAGDHVQNLPGTTSLQTVLAGLLARTPRRVGILGSGKVAEVLARGFAADGHAVSLGTREPAKLAAFAAGAQVAVGSFASVAAEAEVVVLAVKGTAAEAVVRELQGALAGKVVIDATNPIADAPPDNGVLRYFTGPNDSLMERLQAAAPTARFVKAFNSVGNAFMVRPKLRGGRPTMFIAGDDAGAKELVTALLDVFEWDAEDVGSASGARAIEPLCQLWCAPGFQRGDWSRAYKVLRP